MKNMMKRLFSLTLAVILLVPVISSFGLTVSADADVGTCGDNLTWSFDYYTGALEISGEGAMQDYSLEDDYGTKRTTAPWKEYISKITSVTIGDGVTYIGDYAFYNGVKYTTLTIADSVVAIGDYAFYTPGSLTSVKMSSSVESIGDHAFYKATKISSVALGSALKSIGDYAFYSCYNLKISDIPAGIVEIGDYSFYDCDIPNLVIPDAVIRIGNGTFSSCGIKKLTIGKSVESIGDGAFKNNSSLTSITMGSSVTSIGASAFESCRGLKTADLSDSITEISDSVFSSCDALESVQIPDSVTRIGNYAFAGCDSLNSIAIPKNVTSIGESAFSECPLANGITIPASVTNIGKCAFLYTKPPFIDVDEANGYYTSRNGILYNKDMSVLIQYPAGNLRASFTVDEPVKRISEYAFCYANLNTVTVGDSVETLDPMAFTYAGVTEVIIGNSITTITSGAFSECYSLKKITFGDSVTTIGSGAFEFCASLESIYLGDSIITVGSCAFDYCNSLKEVTFGPSVTTIGSGAFSECYSLRNITIPETVTSIGEMIFPHDTTTIYCYNGSAAHKYALGEIGSCYYRLIARKTESGTCGDDLTWNLDTETGVLEISGSGKMTDFYDYEFRPSYFSNCPWLPFAEYIKTAIIGDKVTSIGEYAFFDCRNLESIIINESVTSIAYNALDNKGWGTADVVVYCYEDSYAHTFAEKYGYEYRLIDCRHVFTNYVSDNNYTCTEDGTKTARCDNNCGATDTVTDPGSAAHRYTREDILREPTCTNQGYRLMICDCGADITEVISTVEHKFSEYIYNNDSTCTADGTKTAYCDFGCGTADTVIAEGSAAHRYTSEDVLREPTCSDKGYKLLLCNCGDSITEELPTVDHIMSAYVYNNDAACTYDGTETASCTFGCGTADTRRAEGTMLAHSFTVYVYNNDATVDNDGTKTASCDYGCGNTDTRTAENTRLEVFENPFADIKESYWFYSSVEFVVKKGYMKGMSENTFSPNSDITREQFVLILANIAGVDTNEYKYTESGFTDVKTGQWYSGAVTWAVNEGYVSGMSPDKFGRGQSIQRAALARMLYNYAVKNGIDTTGRAELSAFGDAKEFEKAGNLWMVEPVQWAVDAGIISGMNINGVNCVNPKGTATRAQAARMLMQFGALLPD